MPTSILPLVLLVVILAVLLVGILAYVNYPTKTVPQTPLENFSDNRNSILKLNEYHYRILECLTNSVNLEVEYIECLNNLLLDVRAMEKDIEANQYTVSYFHMVNRIVILLMKRDYKLTDSDLMYVISLYQIMGNFIPLINEQNV